MIGFREWLLKFAEVRGTKLTSTGMNSGGQAQSGMRFTHSVRPFKPMLPSSKSKRLL